MNTLRAINNFLASIAMMLAMCIIFVMVAALTLSASTRFLTGSGFAWFIELPPVLVSWLVSVSYTHLTLPTKRIV